MKKKQSMDPKNVTCFWSSIQDLVKMQGKNDDISNLKNSSICSVTFEYPLDIYL